MQISKRMDKIIVKLIEANPRYTMFHLKKLINKNSNFVLKKEVGAR
jgi:hypothetical protein